MRYAMHVLSALISTGAFHAVKYVSPRQVVRATIRRYRGKIIPGERNNFLLHIGPPNYRERAFIAKCKKTKTPFPVRKIQLKFAPKRR